ncbi:MAG: OmpH family outer membrane protein [Bacteroidetes bacterium]|nr:OmpH family outer membrane protein [Bacteroidota bacterium]
MEEPVIEKKHLSRIVWIVNIILFVGMVILYFIILSHPTPKQKKIRNTTNTIGQSIKIAYVNSDSILANYILAIDKKKELEAKSQKLETEILAKQNGFEKDASYFQEQVNKNALSQQSAQQIYEELMKEQQKIYDLQQQYTAELAQNEMDINSMLLDTLTNFLKRYNLVDGYDYILGVNRAGNVFYTNEQFDITQEVIDGLNEEFQSKHGK